MEEGKEEDKEEKVEIKQEVNIEQKEQVEEEEEQRREVETDSQKEKPRLSSQTSPPVVACFPVYISQPSAVVLMNCHACYSFS